MFRRKDELDIEGQEESAQGSLLASSSETVNVLSPQQAAAYQATQPAAPASTTNGMTNPYSSAASSSYTSPARTTVETPRPATVSQPAATNSFRPNAANNDTARPRPITQETRTPNTPVNNIKDSKRVLTVGNDILLKGEITTCDRLVIEGKVDATVTEVHTLELAEAGTFKGNAQVEYAEISGAFEGELNVKSRLVIYSSGKVSGKITYGEIEIERGGELTGEIKTNQQASSASSSSRKDRKEAA